MRFLVDECTGPTVANWLKHAGHEVFSAYDEARGSSDEELLHKANSENWILITNDKDFGELVFRERRPHCGIIFLRLDNESSPTKIKVLSKLLLDYHDRLAGHFVVVTETQIRFAPDH